MRFVLHDQAIELDYPKSIGVELERLLVSSGTADLATTCKIIISEDGPNLFSIAAGHEAQRSGFGRDEIINVAMDEIVHRLIVDLDSALALHAGAVGWGDASILLAGPTGCGKTSLTAWLVDKGFHYITDELVVLMERSQAITGFCRPMVVKPGSSAQIRSLATFQDERAVAVGQNTLIVPASACPAPAMPCRLIISPRYVAGGALEIVHVSTAEAGLRLMECNLNARNLEAGGFPQIVALARSAPAIEVRYGDFDQLNGVFDSIVTFIVEQKLNGDASRRLLAVRDRPTAIKAPPPSAAAAKPTFPLLAPTPRRSPTTMTIGMATYDDYDGVYFSLQALRLYHSEILDEVELVVVDNNPDGPCSAALKDFENVIPNFRYVPFAERSGTTIKGQIFSEASGEFVLCIDCHVLIVRHAIRRLLDYFRNQPETNDLLQGPLIYDDLRSISTHFEPKWSSGMFGRWATDERGSNPEAAPFEIPMQGMGLFACRRMAWPGFNRYFQGFGGEEGYIHEKFRQAGGRTLCLPFLRWLHRFNRPMGIPYPNTWDDRLRNYLIGHDELGLPTDGVVSHFRELLGKDVVDPMIEQVRMEIASYSRTATARPDHDADTRTLRLAPF